MAEKNSGYISPDLEASLKAVFANRSKAEIEQAKTKEQMERLNDWGTFKDTGRKVEGPGDLMDSYFGAPARVAVSELQKGNLSKEALKHVFQALGSDPRTAPTGYQIASEVTDDPWLGTFLATAVDFGANLPGGPGVMAGVPPVIAKQLGHIKGMEKIIDASERFKALGEKAPSTETRIAQMYGQTGEVRDAMPNLLNRSLDEAPYKDFQKYAREADQAGIDIRDHSGQKPAIYSTRSAMNSERTAPPKPDGYAHGGVVQGFAKGGHVQPLVGVDPFSQDLPPDAPPGFLERLGVGDHLDPEGMPQGMIDRLGPAYTEEVYGQGLGPVKAFGLGALRGASLSASDYLLAKSGLMKPEDIKGYEEANPGSSFAGEAAGLVGSMFLAPELAPASLIAKAGRAGQAAVAGAEALKGTSAAAKLARAIVPATAGSAIEGALYGGVQQSLHESALGDPELTGQKVAANFAYGALFGGALGATLKGAEVGIPQSLKAAKEGLQGLKEYVMGAGTGSTAELPNKGGGLVSKVMSMTGVSDDVIQAFENRAVNLDKDQQRELIEGMTKRLADAHANLETTIKTLNADLRPEETKLLINTANPEAAIDAQQRIIYELNAAEEAMRKRPNTYQQSAVDKLEEVRDVIVGNLRDKSPATILDNLIEAKRRLQSIAYDKLTAAGAEARSVIEAMSRQVRDVVHDPDVFGLAGAAQAAHDEMLTRHYGFIAREGKKPTAFQKTFMSKDSAGRWRFDAAKVQSVLTSKNQIKKEQNVQLLKDFFTHLETLPEHLENTMGSLPNANWDKAKFSQVSGFGSLAEDTLQDISTHAEALQNQKGRGLGLRDMFAGSLGVIHPGLGIAAEAMNIASRPIEYVNKLAELERISGKTTEVMAKMAKGVFDPSVKVAKLGAMPLSTRMRADSDDHAQFEENLLKLSNNPQLLQDQLARNTEKLQDVAPNIAASMQIAGARAASFLSTKIPRGLIEGPFTERYKPSQMEIAKFNRYREIVENPLRIMEQVKSHTLTPEGLETIKTVYPQLYDEMKRQIMEQATDALAKKKTVPYATRQTLTIFMGEPLDPTLTYQHILANQMVFQPPPPPPQMGGVSKKGMEKMSLAKRSKMDRGEMED